MRKMAAGSLTLALIALFPASALGQAWTPPFNLSAPGENASQPQLTVDGKGVVTVVWTMSRYGAANMIQAARLSGGKWSPRVLLSDPTRNASQPRAAVDATGVVTAVWCGFQGIEASRFANDAWSAPVVLPQDKLCVPEVAVDGAGVVTVVWGQEGAIKASRLTGGVWGEAVELAAGENIGEATVAVNAAGAVTAVWTRAAAGGRTIQAASFSGGAWSKPVDVGAIGSGRNPRLVVDASGIATVLWRRQDGISSVIQASRFSGGTWSAPLSLTAATNQVEGDVALAVDRSGAVTAVWTPESGSGTGIQSARFAGGSWSKPVDLGAAGNADGAKVTVDEAGAVTALWSASVGGNYVIQASRFDPRR